MYEYFGATEIMLKLVNELVDLSTLASLFPFLHIFKATDVALV
jgi:hypothetical protein